MVGFRDNIFMDINNIAFLKGKMMDIDCPVRICIWLAGPIGHDGDERKIRPVDFDHGNDPSAVHPTFVVVSAVFVAPEISLCGGMPL